MSEAETRRVILVVAQEDYADKEVDVCRDVLSAAGVEVLVAARERAPARGMHGGRLTPDVAIRQIEPDGFDGVIALGGKGAEAFLWGDPELHGLLRNAKEMEKVVSGIGFGVGALARAGVLDGLRATCYPAGSVMEELQKGGALYRDAAVVREGRVVTGQGLGPGERFAEEVLSAMGS